MTIPPAVNEARNVELKSLWIDSSVILEFRSSVSLAGQDREKEQLT